MAMATAMTRARPSPRLVGPAQALPWAGRTSPGPALALGSLTPRTSVGLSGHAS
jgi:hypothetical protein